jgi:hypothetical protein
MRKSTNEKKADDRIKEYGSGRIKKEAFNVKAKK